MRVKKFSSSSGIPILVGLDDDSNDELTFRVAHQNDIWLHVNGAPGSHVIIQCGENQTQPDKDTLKEAAGLAAWFSKLREGGKVSVHYCLAKNVSKPKKHKPGLVNISQFNQIKVYPKLLGESGA